MKRSLENLEKKEGHAQKVCNASHHHEAPGRNIQYTSVAPRPAVMQSQRAAKQARKRYKANTPHPPIASAGREGRGSRSFYSSLSNDAASPTAAPPAPPLDSRTQHGAVGCAAPAPCVVARTDPFHRLYITPVAIRVIVGPGF